MTKEDFDAGIHLLAELAKKKGHKNHSGNPTIHVLKVRSEIEQVFGYCDLLSLKSIGDKVNLLLSTPKKNYESNIS